MLLRKRCAGVGEREWRLDTVCWFMVGCVAFSVYCDAASAEEYKMTLACVLETALDLAAAALWTEWGVGEAKWGNIV